MPASVWKILNKNSPGTATTFAADDWDFPGRYHNDIDLSATAPSSIKTNTSYWDNRLRIWNPAKTFAYKIRSSALLADRDLTLPLLTAADEVAVLMLAQEFQNKTINVNLNTLRNTSNSIGQLLVNDGTKYLPLTMGATGGYVLAIKNDLTGLEWISPSVSGNTDERAIIREAGTQVGSAARKLNFTNAADFDITEDVANDEIEIGIANNAIGNNEISAHTTTKISITDKNLLHSGIVYADVTTPNITGLGWLNNRHATEHCGIFNGICVAAAGQTFTPVLGAAVGVARFASGTTIGNQAGFRTNVNLMRRQHTTPPRIQGRFAINATDLQKVFIGWVNDTAAFTSGSDPLNAKSGMGLWIDHAVNTNLHFIRNDGTGASTLTEYVPTTAIGAAATSHTFDILADETNTRFRVSIDGQAYHNTSANIPLSATDMAFQCYTETATTAARSMDLYSLFVNTSTL